MIIFAVKLILIIAIEMAKCRKSAGLMLTV